MKDIDVQTNVFNYGYKNMLKNVAISIGIAGLLVAVMGPDMYKQHSIERRLDEKAVFVDGENHFTNMHNKDLDNDGKLESYLHMRTNYGEEYFLIEKSIEKGRHVLTPFHLEEKIVREDN